MAEPHLRPNGSASTQTRPVLTWLLDSLRRLIGRQDPLALPETITPLGNSIFTVNAPCHGDLFNFEVTVTGSWSTLDDPVLGEDALKVAEPHQRKLIAERIRQLSRTFEPDAFGAVEQRINDYLALPLTYNLGRLTCLSRAEVSPEDSLRKALQRQWATISEDEIKQEIEKRHPNHLDEMRQRWSELLGRLGPGNHTAAAVQLAADPRQFGKIAEEITGIWQRNYEWLREVVGKAADEHRHRDVYEYVMSYDSALRQISEQLGIGGPTSTNGAGSPAS